MATRIGTLHVSYSARGIPSYSIELWHDELKKHRLIRGPEASVVQNKTELQVAEWDEKWTDLKKRINHWEKKEAQKLEAQFRTVEAKKELDRLGQILRQTLIVNDVIDWEQLKEIKPFPEPKPSLTAPPPKPTPTECPVEPKETWQSYKPQFSFFDHLMPSRKQKEIARRAARFKADHSEWEKEQSAIAAENEKQEKEYQLFLQQAAISYKKLVEEWEQRSRKYADEQAAANAALNELKDSYLNNHPDAIVEYCSMVLSASEYPDNFPKEFNLEYLAESKTLLIDYSLPAPEHIPTLKEVKYIQARNEFVEQHITTAQHAKLYDDVLYQIILRTVHEILEADVTKAIEAIVCNGWVCSIDRSTGKEVNPCIMSLQVKRDEFMEITLENIDPKSCFKALKGVGSSKLHSLAAIAPILQMKKSDRRFVASYDVAHGLDDSYNLATMDWEDFEHLTRELFEKEFSSNGSEVKVTQASRDGGVDAVVFNPDPIHGGKIVIQAKRYTNTVGVSAVRDLYGTVMNEGANKGILVTTSDFGPDAYSFANGKPLTLLNGANLLYLLEKHGHKAKIDLREAKLER
jgi:restriction system protein